MKRIPFRANFNDIYKAIFFAVCILLVCLASYLLGKHGFGALCGGLAALAVHWYMTMIAVSRFSSRVALQQICEVIERAGYVNTSAGRYRHRLPRPLRFDSQDVCVSQTEKGVNVIGPAYLLAYMEKRLG
jgi:hypothetical protein